MSEPKTVEILADPLFRGGDTVFAVDGHPIHTRVLPASRPADALVFRFHGAIDRTRRPLPAYQENLQQMQDHAHQITICDPTMLSREGFSCSWYAGHEGLDTQGLLLKFCAQATQALGAGRVIYMGSSGGGFASLFLSRHHPGSIALAIVPQTNLKHHFKPGGVTRYLNACWPGLTIEQASERACMDVCDLYRDGFDNSVIYLQSAGDTEHNALQLAPFLHAVWGKAGSEGRDLVLHSDFWGKMGHGGVIPAQGYLPWLKTAILSPATDHASLLMTYHTLGGDMPAMTSAKDRPKADFPANDLRRADLLRDIALGRRGQGDVGRKVSSRKVFP